MKFRRARSYGTQANAAVNDFTSRVDDRTGEVAQRSARTISVAVRLLRLPTAVVLLVPVPFVVMTLLLGVLASGAIGIVILVAGLAMAAVSAMFAGRRHRILQAVEDPEALAAELRVLINLTGKVEETRGALAEIAGGGGWRVFGRLRGVWHGAQMTGDWMDGAGELKRARYFAPPKIGTTVSITIAALWLVPISVLVSLFALIGTIAGSL